MTTLPENRFIIDKKNRKFELYIGNNLVAHSYFELENPDETFDQKYVSLFKLKTEENFKGKGYMKYLLSRIFKYVKIKLKINQILLNVYTDNIPAVNLYVNSGFEIFGEYMDDKPYYVLIKHL